MTTATVREVRVTFTSLRPGVRDRIVIVELAEIDGLSGPTADIALTLAAVDAAIESCAGTRDLDGVEWTADDLTGAEALAEVL